MRDLIARTRQLFAAGLPLILSFEVPVCEHCRAIAPTLEDLARSYVGRALVVRVDNTDLIILTAAESVPGTEHFSMTWGKDGSAQLGLGRRSR